MEIYRFSFLFIFLTNALPFIVCKLQMGASNESFNYEKMHKFGLGKKIIKDYRRLNPQANYGYEYPGPMPTTKRPSYAHIIKYPYESYTQGKRMPGDVRVYSREIAYRADYERGHHYFFEQFLGCIITFISVDTDGCIPIKLRGGAGYTYFATVVRAVAGKPLLARIDAYCLRDPAREDGKPQRPVKTHVISNM